jgi:hypothetical protein
LPLRQQGLLSVKIASATARLAQRYHCTSNTSPRWFVYFLFLFSFLTYPEFSASSNSQTDYNHYHPVHIVSNPLVPSDAALEDQVFSTQKLDQNQLQPFTAQN